ncbi:DMT family transporter [Neorhizobium lilium]|uniref:DMT family transporter n=1 Tax=Neorhizobium lilium TaxID=2503024 RepID=A0A3S3RII7_9HYPH|nr:DMT family transporter [Neorhizobium lilium]RWX78923.1 DMT family transporter [Neorhizobium lilium]
MKLQPHVLGLILIFVSTVVLSTAGLMARLVVLDSVTIVFWRGLAGGLALLVVLFIGSPKHGFRQFSSMKWPALLVAAVTAIGMTFFIAALKATSVAHVSIIFATCPFVSAGLGLILLGERPGRSALLASIVALAGVVFMVGVGEAGGLLGDLFAFAMTVSVALTTVLVRRYPEQPVMPSAALAAIFSALAALPFAEPLAASGRDILIVACFGILGFALGISLLLSGARLLSPVETALIGSLDAPLAPLWVWLFLGEHVDYATMIGGGIVMGAVACHVGGDMRRRTVTCT